MPGQTTGKITIENLEMPVQAADAYRLFPVLSACASLPQVWEVSSGNKTPMLMKTNKRKSYRSEPQLPNPSTTSVVPPEVNGRVIFLGPTETMDALRGLKFMGERVTRQEVKDLTVEWVARAQLYLDVYREPMVLEITREEIEALLKAPKCVSLKVLLAVETKANFNEPHQTFVLMPCDVNGRVIQSSTGSPGAERWSILRNVYSVIQEGGIVSGVERFLKEDLNI